MRLALAFAVLAMPALAQPDPADWDAVLAEAHGQTVFWHAWGGSGQVNDYIGWVADEVGARFGIRLEHVRLADTAEAVSRVLAERVAGRLEGGAVDLVWINGANFAAMKETELLFGPWAFDLPNWQFVDPQENPGVVTDFTIPTDGFESPWSMAQIVFYHDSARLPAPPRSMDALLDFARQNPGRFAYPAPPDFLGTTFLKQALHAMVEDPDLLLEPAADVDAVTAPLWAFLDALHPHLWRRGQAWPQNGPRLRQMMADGEIDLALSFNPNEAASAIANRELPDTVRAYVLDGGTIGNASFVAIPFNASAKAGAMVVADFLLSPQAQARKEDPAIWGATTVLSRSRLPDDWRAAFDAIERGPGAPPPGDLGRTLPEPHPSWVGAVNEGWQARYGTGR